MQKQLHSRYAGKEKMALTRKMLKEMGISDENAEEIIRSHAESIEALKGYKADSERLSELERELTETKKSEGDFRSKYQELEKSYEALVGEVTKERTDRKKRSEYEKLLRGFKIPEGCIDPIIRVTDLESFALSENGGIADEEAVKGSISENWSAFIPKTHTVSASVATPPAAASEKGFSPEEIRRMTPREINENYQAIRKSLGRADG